MSEEKVENGAIAITNRIPLQYTIYIGFNCIDEHLLNTLRFIFVEKQKLFALREIKAINSSFKREEIIS